MRRAAAPLLLLAAAWSCRSSPDPGPEARVDTEALSELFEAVGRVSAATYELPLEGTFPLPPPE